MLHAGAGGATAHNRVWPEPRSSETAKGTSSNGTSLAFASPRQPACGDGARVRGYARCTAGSVGFGYSVWEAERLLVGGRNGDAAQRQCRESKLPRDLQDRRGIGDTEHTVHRRRP